MSSLTTVLSRCICVATIASLLFGCSSTAGSRSGEKLRVSLRNYKQNHLFEVVSESHTNMVEYYSQVRDSAARKIVADDLASALVDELSRRGFKRFKQPGRAPSSGGSILLGSLEIATSSGVEHWVIGNGSDPDEFRAFQENQQAFIELYNAVNSYQTVDNEAGRAFFDNKNVRTNSAGSRP